MEIVFFFFFLWKEGFDPGFALFFQEIGKIDIAFDSPVWDKLYSVCIHPRADEDGASAGFWPHFGIFSGMKPTFFEVKLCVFLYFFNNFKQFNADFSLQLSIRASYSQKETVLTTNLIY